MFQLSVLMGPRTIAVVCVCRGPKSYKKTTVFTASAVPNWTLKVLFLTDETARDYGETLKAKIRVLKNVPIIAPICHATRTKMSLFTYH